MFCQNKNCNNKLTCIDKTCELGHDVCYDKRRLINKIYNLYKNNNNDNLCNYYITCYDKNCKLNHQLNYKYRKKFKMQVKQVFQQDLFLFYQYF